MKKIVIVLFFVPQIALSVTHTVTTNADSGAGSLRAAITASLAGDTINFSIGAGVQTIQVLSDMPLITVNNLIIDGTTQPGWSVNNPVIVIDGSLWPSPGVATGLLTLSGTTGCVIQGLVLINANKTRQEGLLITDAGDVQGANNNAVYGCFIGIDQTGTTAAPNVNGIRINAFTDDASNNNIVGGLAAGQRNVISGNRNGGVELLKNVNNTIIQNNYIGTNKTGTVAVPNKGFGIGIFGSLTPLPQEHCIGTIIGGSTSAQRNIISGNSSGDPANPSIGIAFLLNCIDTIIQGNYIGVDVTGVTALPNDAGIVMIGAYTGDPASNGAIDGTIIGGASSGQANIISSNNQDGIVFQNDVINTTIQGNFIGTDATATHNLGNGFSGILIQGQNGSPCTNNLTGGVTSGQGNTIVFNGSASATDQFGILLNGDPTTPDILNPILGNSIYSNSNNGIELLNNGNDMQLLPTILSAQLILPENIIMVTAMAPAAPAASNFRLEFFVNSVNRNPITEGQTFIGAVSPVPTGEMITATFAAPLSIAMGEWVSATATNLNNTGGTPGDTSEFSGNTQLETVIINEASPISQNIINKYCRLHSLEEPTSIPQNIYPIRVVS